MFEVFIYDVVNDDTPIRGICSHSGLHISQHVDVTIEKGRTDVKTIYVLTKG